MAAIKEGKRNGARFLEAKITNVSVINKLPVEVLSMIWKLVVSERLAELKCLLLVCRLWHSHVVEDPQLWAHINLSLPYHPMNPREWVRDHGSFLFNCLERSRSTPLDVVLDTGYLGSGTTRAKERMTRVLRSMAAALLRPKPVRVANSRKPSETGRASTRPTAEEEEDCNARSPEPVLNLLEQLAGRDGQHVRRWKSLTVIFPLDEELIWSVSNILLTHSMPMLSCLHLSNLDVSLSERVENSFDTENPGRPSNLKLGKFKNWEFLAMLPVSLSELSISTDLNPSFGSQLSRLVHLRILTLSCSHSNQGDQLGVPVKCHISLPLLTDLTLKNDAKHIDAVHFDLPSLGRLYFQLGYEEFRKIELPIVQPSLVHWVPPGNPSTMEIEHAGGIVRHLLLHFFEARELCVPDILADVAMDSLKGLLSKTLLPSSWEVVSFSRAGNIVKTLSISDITYQGEAAWKYFVAVKSQ